MGLYAMLVSEMFLVSDDNTTVSFQLCYFFHMVGMLIITDYLCTREHLYRMLYGQILLLCVCVLILYWLLIVQLVTGWVYFTCDMCLCGYHVITNILMSMFVSL